MSETTVKYGNQAMALLKLAMLAEQDIREGDTFSLEQVLQQLQAARN